MTEPAGKIDSGHDDGASAPGEARPPILDYARPRRRKRMTAWEIWSFIDDGVYLVFGTLGILILLGCLCWLILEIFGK